MTVPNDNGPSREIKAQNKCHGTVQIVKKNLGIENILHNAISPNCMYNEILIMSSSLK